LTFSLSLSVAAKEIVVVIDPGHGGRDPGTTGSKKIHEKVINLAIALELGKLIENNHKDVKVHYTRVRDKKPSLLERAEFANKKNADLFISIHTNAMETNTKMKGTETYIYGIPAGREAFEVEKRENNNNTETKSCPIYNNSQQNKLLAQEIQKAFKKDGRIDKGVKKNRFLVLKYTKMPAVLVEVGFITNLEEEKYLTDSAGQKAIAKSIYTAFSNYKKKHIDNTKNKKGTKDQAIATNTSTKSENKTNTTTKKEVQTKKKITYKVQFLLQDRKLPKNSPKFKGLSPVDFYIEKGTYKYTYGNSSNVKEIEKKQKEVRKLFKDAFIVIFEDEKRVGVHEMK